MHALIRAAAARSEEALRAEAGLESDFESDLKPGLESRLVSSPDEASAVSRRGFLASGVAAGLVLAIGAGAPRNAQAAALGQEGAAIGPLAPNAFVRVGTDNTVTVICKHFEMGEGNTTGLATLVAEELDADWTLVRTEFAPANPKLYANLAFGTMQGTGGSTAIANSFLQMRTAGAACRTMLVAAAAESWGVPASEIRTSRSVLSHPGSGKRATYGEMAVAASRQPVPEKPVLKSASEFTLIGRERATPRVDSLAKSTGKATYTIDVRLPGMLTALIAWPPTFGATVESFDATQARQVPGVTDVVQVPEGVAVVARSTWAAMQGRQALQVKWKDLPQAPELSSDTLLAKYRALATQPGTPFGRAATDPADKAVKAVKAVETIEAVYEFPFLAHASMEPMNCVAWLHDGMLETWGGHQFPTFDHMFAAKAADLPMEKVTLHTLISGGSFGRRANAYSDFTVAAVHVAVAIKGRAPVRLQYSREDDMTGGFYRPMMVHSVKVGLDDRGRIATWQHAIVGQSIVAGTALEAGFVKDGIDPTSVEGVFPSMYDLPMISGQLHTVSLPVRPLWWRSVGHTHTAYVMETLMDELARAAGQDPVAYRLALLDKSPRAAGVLRLAADKAGWGRAPRAGVAQGIAVHHSFDTYVAEVAEVSMKDGKVRVERVVCAVDCGVAVNPDVIRAQMEGGIGYALSALYYGEIELDKGRAVQNNFHTYRALRMNEMPVVEVHIVASTEAPTGVGEPGVPPLGPAVANAVVRLGGQPVRRLPFTRAGLVA